MVVAPCRHWTDRLAARKKKKKSNLKFLVWTLMDDDGTDDHTIHHQHLALLKPCPTSVIAILSFLLLLLPHLEIKIKVKATK